MSDHKIHENIVPQKFRATCVHVYGTKDRENFVGNKISPIA